MRLDQLACRRSLLAVALTPASTLSGNRPASAVYGEFAKMGSDGVSTLASGDASNECLFATPGTGICQVYKSSDPRIWQTPDTAVALAKLIKAADNLNQIDGYIKTSKWTAIAQALGASRDLREAVGFLTARAEDPKAAATAKKVFQALDGVYVAAQKKDASTATLYYGKYAAAMPELLGLLS